MATYTVELTDEEYSILSYYHTPELWVTGLFTHRANVAVEEMFKEEIQSALTTGKTVPADRDAAILASTLPALKDRAVPSGPIVP
jgi:hypothetical protein